MHIVTKVVVTTPEPKSARGFGFHPLCWVVFWTLAPALFVWTFFPPRRLFDLSLAFLLLSSLYWLCIRPLARRYLQWVNSWF